MKPITFTTQATVEIVDADKHPIGIGSVLQHIKEKDRGVVTRIALPGMRPVVICEGIGDVHIQKSPGCHRVTTRYHEWLHVPHAEQTYEERFLAWTHREYDHDEDRSASNDEGLAIDGIMALLPEDIVDWESGPWPDRIEDALRFLVEHLNTLNKKK